MKFSELKIDKELVNALLRRDIIELTVSQEKAMPPILLGDDILLQSETGSGKTLAFAIPIIQKIKKDDLTGALIIAPTRELVRQIALEFRYYGEYKHIFVQTIYGGVGFYHQIHGAKKAQVVIGTPGRLLDLESNGDIDLSKVKHLILDEADRMFDMGFINDIKRIIEKCKNREQTLLFSATLDEKSADIAKEYMNNPQRFILNRQVDPKLLNHEYIMVRDEDKASLLLHLIEKNKGSVSLIFCNKRRTTEWLARFLKKQGVTVESLNGRLSQARREKVIEDAISSKIDIITATDVASRGLHIESITHIYNYDLPREIESYVHRVGRTARMGRKGKAMTLVTKRDYATLKRIESRFNIKIEKMETPEFRRIEIEPVRQFNKVHRRFPRRR